MRTSRPRTGGLQPAWGHYDPDVIRNLKEESDHIFVSGSGQLVRGMLADGLVDEMMLCVFPVALGRGEKLFGEGVDATKLTLKDSFACENGVMVLTYGPA